jgi:diguanylate cyclase (GGDEF)-like protein
VSDTGFAEVTGGTAPGLASPRLVRRLAELDPALEPLLPGATNVAVLPLRIDDEAHGALLVAFGGGRRRQVPETTIVALEQAARLIASTIERARLHASLEQLAARDALTGLVNRRVFEETLVREIARSKRTREPLSLVVVDVDHFKRVNDTHGHHVGDEVLRHVGKALGASVRASDLVARFGGEEFVALLPGCGPADAYKVAENLRTAVAADGPPVPVTASAGVASYPTQATDGTSLFEAADAALYEAKREGRDRTVQAARRIQLVAS